MRHVESGLIDDAGLQKLDKRLALLGLVVAAGENQRQQYDPGDSDAPPRRRPCLANVHVPLAKLPATIVAATGSATGLWAWTGTTPIRRNTNRSRKCSRNFLNMSKFVSRRR